MVTSELQKVYNLNNPKGGYSYYTLYRGESTDTKPAYAQTGDVFEEYGTGKVYTCVRTKGKAVWTEDPNAKRQTETGGGGGSLPADFPAEGSANANKFIGFDANGDYAAKDAPSGGAEKFIVTLTQDEQTEEWTFADGATIADIAAADEAGKIVVAKYPVGEGMNIEIQLVAVDDAQGVIAAIFAGIDVFNENKSVVSVACINQGEEDAIQVEETPIPTSTNEPLIVTLTAGSTEGQFVGDKTYKEAYDAYIAGQNVVFYAPSVNGMAEHVNAAENNTSGDNPYALATKSFTSNGAANDYITITVGG